MARRQQTVTLADLQHLLAESKSFSRLIRSGHKEDKQSPGAEVESSLSEATVARKAPKHASRHIPDPIETAKLFQPQMVKDQAKCAIHLAGLEELEEDSEGAIFGVCVAETLACQ